MTREKGYSSKVLDCTRNLSKKEEVFLSFMTGFTSLDEIIENPDDKLFIRKPEMATIEVHNENAENKDYNVYVFFNMEEKVFYYTSSPSCAEAYANIRDIMGEEPFDIFVHKLPSSNFSGRFFLTCSIALDGEAD